jgi:hypothetical protein
MIKGNTPLNQNGKRGKVGILGKRRNPQDGLLFWFCGCLRELGKNVTTGCGLKRTLTLINFPV